MIRERLTTGTVASRKTYLQAIIDKIEVDNAQIRICGSKGVLKKAVWAIRAGTLEHSEARTNWRARHDSNV